VSGDSPAVEQAVRRLEDVAAADPCARPLALILAEALRVAHDPAWEARPAFERATLEQGLPLLYRQPLPVSLRHVDDLFSRLAAAAARVEGALEEKLVKVAKASAADQVTLLEASVDLDFGRLAPVAIACGVDQVFLNALGQVVVMPLLQACGRRGAPLLAGWRWDAGYCPVCAAWPVLAEQRGTERRRWLRCGRCGSGWTYSSHTCAFCGNEDHRTQGYLAPDGAWESQRATTCDRCHGYLKTLATTGPLEPADIALRDLTTLELDLGAIQRGYARPAAPGARLSVKLVPM